MTCYAIRALMRDPDVYPNPDLFDPETRFLPPSPQDVQTDPRTLVFGFGRRRCPGRSTYSMR